MRDNGSMIRLMAKAYMYRRRAANSKVSSLMTSKTALGLNSGVMGLNIGDTTTMARNTAKASSYGATAAHTMAPSTRTK